MASEQPRPTALEKLAFLKRLSAPSRRQAGTSQLGLHYSQHEGRQVASCPRTLTTTKRYLKVKVPPVTYI